MLVVAAVVEGDIRVGLARVGCRAGRSYVVEEVGNLEGRCLVLGRHMVVLQVVLQLRM